MRTRYLLKMFLEFSKAYGIHDSFDNFEKYNDLFARWVYEKEKASKSYIQLFEYMKDHDEIESSIIAEFGKGKYDTTAISMDFYTPHKAIIVSPYAETIDFSEIERYKGELITVDGETFVKYDKQIKYSLNLNCNPMFNDDIDTLMIQVPFTGKELKPFLNLVDSNKTLFIGTYGAMEDKDKDKNIKTIRNLYDELYSISNRDVKFCLESQNGAYLSAVKINSKQRVMCKTLSK